MAPWDGQSPQAGNLPSDLLAVLASILCEHTSTASSCWFCLWDGYGVLRRSPAVNFITAHTDGLPGQPQDGAVPPALPAEILQGPRVRLPHRDYILFEGPVGSATDLSELIGGPLLPQSPNLFWTEDRAWCVASEIDLFCTLVGGSEQLVEALLADPTLEVWRIGPTDPIAFNSDLINARS